MTYRPKQQEIDALLRAQLGYTIRSTLRLFAPPRPWSLRWWRLVFWTPGMFRRVLAMDAASPYSELDPDDLCREKVWDWISQEVAS